MSIYELVLRETRDLLKNQDITMVDVLVAVASKEKAELSLDNTMVMVYLELSQLYVLVFKQHDRRPPFDA